MKSLRLLSLSVVLAICLSTSSADNDDQRVKRQLYRDQTKIIKPHDRKQTAGLDEADEPAPLAKPNRGRGRSRYQEPRPSRPADPAPVPAQAAYQAPPSDPYYEPRPAKYNTKPAYRPQPKPQYNEYVEEQQYNKYVEKPQYNEYVEKPQYNEYERDEYSRKPILINTQPSGNSGYKPKPAYEEYGGQYQAAASDKKSSYNTYSEDRNGGYEQQGDGYKNDIPGTPGVDYPVYHTVPDTQFDCSSVPVRPGMYADVSSGCQAYRICDDGRHGPGGAAFLCTNGTIFNQAEFTCDWWYNVDCKYASELYRLNEDISRNPFTRNEYLKQEAEKYKKPEAGYAPQEAPSRAPYSRYN